MIGLAVSTQYGPTILKFETLTPTNRQTDGQNQGGSSRDSSHGLDTFEVSVFWVLVLKPIHVSLGLGLERLCDRELR